MQIECTYTVKYVVGVTQVSSTDYSLLLELPEGTIQDEILDIAEQQIIKTLPETEGFYVITDLTYKGSKQVLCLFHNRKTDTIEDLKWFFTEKEEIPEVYEAAIE